MARRSVVLQLVLVFFLSITISHAHAMGSKKQVQRIQSKVERVKQEIMRRARSGEDVSGTLKKMEEIKDQLDERKLSEAEVLLDDLLLVLQTVGEVASNPGELVTDDFVDPQKVKILGYDGGAMEPFITRDGKYLLFNSAPGDPQGKNSVPDLHFSKRKGDTTFLYMGKIQGANSDFFDGGPTVDRNGRLYFSSPREYDKRLEMLYTGRFADGKVTGVTLIEGNVSRKKGGWINMDSEISADGKTLYFTDNEWNRKFNVPRSSDLRIAKWNSGKFMRTESSNDILKNINTEELEYAAAISGDELELFFTRTRFRFKGRKLDGADTRILVARRESAGKPFSEPERISSIAGFVEGPTITSDGKFLYFHRKQDGKFQIYMVTRRK